MSKEKGSKVKVVNGKNSKSIVEKIEGIESPKLNITVKRKVTTCTPHYTPGHELPTYVKDTREVSMETESLGEAASLLISIDALTDPRNTEKHAEILDLKPRKLEQSMEGTPIKNNPDIKRQLEELRDIISSSSQDIRQRLLKDI